MRYRVVVESAHYYPICDKDGRVVDEAVTYVYDHQLKDIAGNIIEVDTPEEANKVASDALLTIESNFTVVVVGEYGGNWYEMRWGDFTSYGMWIPVTQYRLLPE